MRCKNVIAAILKKYLGSPGVLLEWFQSIEYFEITSGVDMPKDGAFFSNRL